MRGQKTPEKGKKKIHIFDLGKIFKKEKKFKKNKNKYLIFYRGIKISRFEIIYKNNLLILSLFLFFCLYFLFLVFSFKFWEIDIT